MHKSRQLSAIMWKNKKLVVIISFHAVHIQFPCQYLVVSVPSWNGSICEEIQTSPMHLEYTTHMRGVDVANQLRASYSCQTWSHKWWHQVFFFLIDTSIVNMYAIYLDKCRSCAPPQKPMTHLQFQIQLCEALIQNWEEHKGRDLWDAPQGRKICFRKFGKLQNPCVVCNDGSKLVIRPKTFCPTCKKFMCWQKGCFGVYHNNLL